MTVQKEILSGEEGSLDADYIRCFCLFKGGDAALVAQSSVDEEHEDELYYDEEIEAAYVVGIETALFTREDVLLDS